MREIKFRAWNKYGMSYFTFKDVTEFDGSPGRWPEPTEIMQYTGLKDKNGKEIYEGDIVHCSIDGDNVGNIDSIEFKNSSFWLRYRDRSISSWMEFGNDLEVIGNIYKNPELLKK